MELRFQWSNKSLGCPSFRHPSCVMGPPTPNPKVELTVALSSLSDLSDLPQTCQTIPSFFNKRRHRPSKKGPIVHGKQQKGNDNQHPTCCGLPEEGGGVGHSRSNEKGPRASKARHTCGVAYIGICCPNWLKAQLLHHQSKVPL